MLAVLRSYSRGGFCLLVWAGLARRYAKLLSSQPPVASMPTGYAPVPPALQRTMVLGEGSPAAPDCCRKMVETSCVHSCHFVRN